MKTFSGLFEQQNFSYCCLFFQNVVRIKPSSSRSKSPEIYYYCTGHQQSDFFKLIDKKGTDISLDEFNQFFPQIKEMTEYQRLQFLQNIRKMHDEGKLKDKDIKFTFEKQLVEESLKVSTEELHLSPKELEAEFDRTYKMAVKRKLVADLPDNVMDAIERSEKQKKKIEKELNDMIRKPSTVKMELLDLDEERESKNETSMEDSLPTDFKHPWEPGYDDYLFELFKIEVLQPMSKGKDMGKMMSEEEAYSEDEDNVDEKAIRKEHEERQKKLLDNAQMDEFVEKMKRTSDSRSEEQKTRDELELEELTQKSIDDCLAGMNYFKKLEKQSEIENNKKSTSQEQRFNDLKEQSRLREERNKKVNLGKKKKDK